jgi:fructose-specific component phosphotransferase system IIB-like protein
MEYAARLARFPSIVTPLVTLVLGAAAATGAYALIDDKDAVGASKVIVVEQPSPNAADIPGKNESATAAAITQPGGVELRGSKASPTPESPDPHAPAVSLRNP